jgi:ABC-2 type transport system permease protein
MSSDKTWAHTKTLGRASSVFFGQCLQAALMYRSALAIFILSEGVSYAGYIAFWHKAATTNPAQHLYKPMTLVVYFAIASYHHGIQHHASSREVGSDIRLGKLSYSIVRPFPFLLQAFLRSVAFTATYAVLLLPLIVCAFLFVPGLWTAWIQDLHSNIYWQYPLALFIGLMSGWIIRIVIGLIAFDMSQIWGPDTFFIALYFAASGSVFPVDLLPGWALSIVKWTPMYYMVGFPVLSILGRIPDSLFLHDFAQGCLVLFATVALMSSMWMRGLKKFEAIGI